MPYKIPYKVLNWDYSYDNFVQLSSRRKCHIKFYTKYPDNTVLYKAASLNIVAKFFYGIGDG
jgi:hypothetical protein